MEYPTQTKFAPNCQLWGNILFICIYVYITRVCPGQLCRPMKTQMTSSSSLSKDEEIEEEERERGGKRGREREALRLSCECYIGDLGVWLLLWRLWTNHSELLCGPSSYIEFFCCSAANMTWPLSAFPFRRLFCPVQYAMTLSISSCNFQLSNLCWHLFSSVISSRLLFLYIHAFFIALLSYGMFYEGAEVNPCV